MGSRESLALLLSGLPERELRREGLVVAEGRLLAERLLSAPGYEPLGLACVPALAQRLGELAAGRCPLAVLPEPELAAMAGFPFHRGVLAVARRPPPLEAADVSASLLARPERPPLLLLPATGDPENLGSLVRSAAALGFGGLLLGPASADPLSRRALRVSMGAALGLPFASIGGPEGLGPFRKAGYRLAAAALAEGALRAEDWAPAGPAILALGEEYGGLGPEWLGAADEVLCLPMAPGIDSLNVAAAGAILMYLLSRGGRLAFRPGPG